MRVNVHYTKPECPWRRVIRRIEGDPTIEMTVKPFDLSTRFEDVKQSHSIVPAMMELACEVAGLWCASRGIAVPYRGATRSRVSTEIPEDMLNIKQAALNAYTSTEIRYLAYNTIDDRVVSRPFCSWYPVKHEGVGVDAYVKVTSPMRRYPDMIAHWQIEAALRLEAKSGRPLTEMDSPMLPFSQTQVQKSIARLFPREQLIKRKNRQANLHWVCQLLTRAHEFKEPVYPKPWPEYLDAFCLRRQDGTVWAKLKQLNLGFKIYANDNHGEQARHMRAGDWWKVKLDSIKSQGNWIGVEPIERTSRIEI